MGSEDSWWTIRVSSLVIVILAVLVLSCRQTDRQTDRQTWMNALLPWLGVSKNLIVWKMQKKEGEYASSSFNIFPMSLWSDRFQEKAEQIFTGLILSGTLAYCLHMAWHWLTWFVKLRSHALLCIHKVCTLYSCSCNGYWFLITESIVLFIYFIMKIVQVVHTEERRRRRKKKTLNFTVCMCCGCCSLQPLSPTLWVIADCFQILLLDTLLDIL